VTDVIEVACLGSLWLIGGACAPLTGRRMVSTVFDLVSTVVPFLGWHGGQNCPHLRNLKSELPCFAPSC